MEQQAGYLEHVTMAFFKKEMEHFLYSLGMTIYIETRLLLSININRQRDLIQFLHLTDQDS